MRRCPRFARRLPRDPRAPRQQPESAPLQDGGRLPNCRRADAAARGDGGERGNRGIIVAARRRRSQQTRGSPSSSLERADVAFAMRSGNPARRRFEWFLRSSLTESWRIGGGTRVRQRRHRDCSCDQRGGEGQRKGQRNAAEPRHHARERAQRELHDERQAQGPVRRRQARREHDRRKNAQRVRTPPAGSKVGEAECARNSAQSRATQNDRRPARKTRR